MSVSYKVLSRSLKLHLPLSNVSEVSFNSPLSLTIVGQTEPKIFRFVYSQTVNDFCFLLADVCVKIDTVIRKRVLHTATATASKPDKISVPVLSST